PLGGLATALGTFLPVAALLLRLVGVIGLVALRSERVLLRLLEHGDVEIAARGPRRRRAHVEAEAARAAVDRRPAEQGLAVVGEGRRAGRAEPVRQGHDARGRELVKEDAVVDGALLSRRERDPLAGARP